MLATRTPSAALQTIESAAGSEIGPKILQVAIMAGPDRQPVVRDSRGLRKIRFGRRGAQGKRAGFRIGHAYFPDYQIVLMITLYAKNEKSDLSAADRNEIARIIGLIEQQLEQEIIK